MTDIASIGLCTCIGDDNIDTGADSCHVDVGDATTDFELLPSVVDEHHM